MKYSLLILLYVFGVLLSSSAGAEELTPSLPLSGRVFTDFYAPTSDLLGGNWQQVSGSLWLQGDPKLGENSSAHFTFTLDDVEATTAIPATGTSSQIRVGLREGYVNYSKLGWDLKAGKVILPWGKSDVINPTDLLTAKDYTFFNPEDEVRRIGAIGAVLNWTPNEGNSPVTLTWVAIPVFAQSKLLLAPGQIPADVTLSNTAQTAPYTVSNSETAFRVSYAGNQWDASLLAFRGWNHLPDFQVTSLNITPPQFSLTAAPTFHRYKALGGDTSLTFDQWILRAETAYVWTENNDGTNPLVQPSHWDSVLGVERPFGNDFRAQVQFVYRYFPFYRSPSEAGGDTPQLVYINQQVAQTNALIQNYQDRIRPSGTFRISYTNDPGGFASEIFILMNFVGGDYLLRPQLSYLWTDSIKMTSGLDYYAGPKDRPLGLFASYNALYTELKYSF